MSFLDYEIKREYRNLEKNIVKSFFMPLMGESVLYQRAVGYFSSSALVCYSLGITQLIKNGGRIELIASPNLTEEDMHAIDVGYELRDDIIERSIIDALEAPINRFQEERLNLLATYIADEKLEIKIAFVDSDRKIGIYHEKLGLLHDCQGNIVSFSGSMNESENGFIGNYETIDVFCNWKEPERVDDKVKAFQKIWNNDEQGVVTKRFPNIEKQILEKYKKAKVNLVVDEEEYGFTFSADDYKLKNLVNKITMPADTLYDYQNDAIAKWKENNYRGIFDMCTGAGKTYTGIGAIKQLHEDKNGRLAVIIVAPYQHLVEQWVEDLENFNIHPVVGYSGGKHNRYRKELKSQIFDYNLGVKDFICFICTNASFKIREVQEILGGIKNNVLIVVDEAHNFGTKALLNTLLQRYEYRLALSATLDRYGDPDGTKGLYDYFGEKCIEYTLEQAIDEKKLTEYYYRPFIVCLTPDELEKYEHISREMRKYIHVSKNGKPIFTEKAKKLAIKRARIVAGASEKAQKLLELIQPYTDDNNMLVYCGATTLNGEDVDDNGINDDIRQIDYITKLLGENLGMNVAQFTSNENMLERENLIRRFKAGEELQGLIAIKCLDEGVNIPSIKTAFILASTTNPKEYIQRRGRVLRTYPGKEYAEIYDMVTLPRPIEQVYNTSSEDLEMDISLVKNELNRVREFKRLSLNPYDSNPIIEAIADAYDLSITGEEYEDLDDYHFMED